MSNQPSPTTVISGEFPPPPSRSSSVLSKLPSGAVQITIPPMLREPVGLMAISIICLCLILSVSLLIWSFRAAGEDKLSQKISIITFAVACASVSGLVAMLWKGLRWSIVTVDAVGVHLELRGLIVRERRFDWPRDQIVDVRRKSAVEIIGRNRIKLGQIDAVFPSEERWLAGVIKQALQLPPAAPAATAL